MRRKKQMPVRASGSLLQTHNVQGGVARPLAGSVPCFDGEHRGRRRRTPGRPAPQAFGVAPRVERPLRRAHNRGARVAADCGRAGRRGKGAEGGATSLFLAPRRLRRRDAPNHRPRRRSAHVSRLLRSRAPLVAPRPWIAAQRAAGGGGGGGGDPAGALLAPCAAALHRACAHGLAQHARQPNHQGASATLSPGGYRCRRCPTSELPRAAGVVPVRLCERRRVVCALWAAHRPVPCVGARAHRWWRPRRPRRKRRKRRKRRERRPRIAFAEPAAASDRLAAVGGRESEPSRAVLNAQLPDRRAARR